jgi:hypothetical protein
MTPWLRKLALTLHITTSVGWLGAVAGVFGLALVGLVSDDAEAARAAYIAMESTAWFVLVPLALAALLTGVIQGLGTRWGLFRHYWVVFKLIITVVATVVLMLYLQTLGSLAEIARAGGDVETTSGLSPVLHAGVALLLLFVTTTLAVYKPRGLTPWGTRKRVTGAQPPASDAP